MRLELDHFFILVDQGAPQAEALEQLGLTEGTANRHPGQGTANRRYFFHNAFLELLWVDDASEAQSAATQRTGLWQRWSRRESGASPFGICFRPAPGETGALPFATWNYRPGYLPSPLSIQMSTRSEQHSEPLLFFIAFGRSAIDDEPARRQPLDHSAGLRRVTRLKLTLIQQGPLSQELQAIQKHCPQVEFATGNSHRLEVGFDHESKGWHHELVLLMPLVFSW
jgi:hypothetical protein